MDCVNGENRERSRRRKRKKKKGRASLLKRTNLLRALLPIKRGRIKPGKKRGERETAAMKQRGQRRYRTPSDRTSQEDRQTRCRRKSNSPSPHVPSHARCANVHFPSTFPLNLDTCPFLFDNPFSRKRKSSVSLPLPLRAPHTVHTSVLPVRTYYSQGVLCAPNTAANPFFTPLAQLLLEHSMASDSQKEKSGGGGRR